MKYTFTLIVTLVYLSIYSQNVDTNILEEIYNQGVLFTKELKKGEIQFLKNSNPPKDTWLFSKLEYYKNSLESNEILYGSLIMPSIDKTTYSYNLFAYDIKKESYYFVAIVSYKILESGIKFENAYLFTEKKSLTDWWKRVFVLYKNKEIYNIPEKYIFKVCPPPPFK